VSFESDDLIGAAAIEAKSTGTEHDYRVRWPTA
jgi:hypothetical protein